MTTIDPFAELTKQVHLLNDLILSDLLYENVDYSEEFLTFSRHLFTTKYWFVRISWANKRRYILALMEDVKSAWTLSLLLKSLWNCRPKDAILSASEPRSWSVYDQVPMDHNRTALPISTLGQVMTNDRKWFHSLDSESQALVLSELLTIAGGPVMWEALRRGQTIYERHRDQQLRNLLECVVVDQNPKVENEPMVEPAGKKAANAMDKVLLIQSTEELGTLNSPAVTAKPEKLSAEMLNAQKNLDASLAAWDNVIKGIQQSQKLEELEMTFKDGTIRKIWKVNRVKPEVFETVDFLQLLPSVVAKRIFFYLPQANFGDYMKVNKYWAYLIDEYKIELATRVKLDIDIEKLQEIMIQHDVSLEAIGTPGVALRPGSFAASVAVSSRKAPSYWASERSAAGAISFRHMVVDKLKPSYKIRPKPIRKMTDLTERLERRGAADENLWQWCENVLKYCKGQHPKAKSDEGLLKCGEIHFPCPLLKHSLKLPLSEPLAHDPACPTAEDKKARRNFSYSPVNESKHKDQKRFCLWSRDFSSFYKVYKVASYQSPI